jgi:3-phosphoshikimate 1-carboxyvinyltransferase
LKKRRLTRFAVSDAIVRIPGSKSEANRLLALGCLTPSPFTVTPLPDCDDVTIFVRALQNAGVEFESSGETITIRGQLQSSHAGKVVLDMGMAGTAARFWTALSCFRPGETVLTGAPRLCERPMYTLIDALARSGAKIECMGAAGRLPLRILGDGNFRPTEFHLTAGISSQPLTALMLCAPALPIDSKIFYDRNLAVSQSYANLTRELLSTVGVEWHATAYGYRLIACRPTESACVTGDWTAASYPITAALLQKIRLRFPDLTFPSLQRDASPIWEYRDWGLKIESDGGGIKVENGLGPIVRPFDRDCADYPDLAQTWAVLALFSGGTCVLRGLETLKHKETDRIAALCNELTKFGARVEANGDALVITPGTFPTHPPTVETYNDHRMAMAFSLAAFAPCGVIIQNPDVVTKSFPRFWDEAPNWGISLLE